MIVVSDASPLIELARIGHLDLLEKLCGRVYIPGAVWQEIVADVRPPVSEQAPQAGWIEQVQVDPNMTLGLPLDAGEAEAVVLAVQMGADYLLVDERQARGIAKEHGLQIIGTLGILLSAKEDGLIEAVMPLVDQMIGNNFRISEPLYEAIKAEAGE